jgi:hypothetical protein
MTGLPGLSRQRLVQLCAAFAALMAGAIVLGWRTGEAPANTTAPAAPADWALPQVNPPDPARDATILTARHPWGGGAAFRDIDAGPRAPSAPAVPWRLAGIVVRGDERLALVMTGQGAGTKLEYRATGDRLPDGSVLVQIGADSATSQNGEPPVAERRVYRLFEKTH